MITIFSMFLLTLLMVTAAGIVRTSDLFAATMLSGIFSLLMAATFFMLDAADVALTEAAVGAGVSTVLFLGALALTGSAEKPSYAHRGLPLAVVGATTLTLIYATFDKPRLGDPQAPVHQHVAPWYLEKTPELIDIPNVVTAVLGSFRGYDTLGEVFVVFTAGIGVLFLLSVGRPHLLPRFGTIATKTAGLKHHLLPRAVGKVLLPFLILFGLYVQFHGEHGPGGGFQAGALVAAAIILYALLEGETEALRVLPGGVLLVLVAGGALLYAAVGVAGILAGGNFLDYSVLASDPVHGQHLGLLLIEFGVGVTVTGVLLSIFHAFAARENAS